jgi:hypothetical protein
MEAFFFRIWLSDQFEFETPAIGPGVSKRHFAGSVRTPRMLKISLKSKIAFCHIYTKIWPEDTCLKLYAAREPIEDIGV